RCLVAPPYRPDAGYEAEPIGRNDEDEDCSEEPERSFDQMRPYDAFEKAVQPLDEPLEKILRPIGHLLHVPRRELRKDDQSDRDDPGDDHRIGDRKAEGTSDLYGAL